MRDFAVLGPLRLVDHPAPACALVGEVFGLGRLAPDQSLLAGVGRVAIHALFVAMQQIGQRVGLRGCSNPLS